jgi:hypothetical protein
LALFKYGEVDQLRFWIEDDVEGLENGYVFAVGSSSSIYGDRLRK